MKYNCSIVIPAIKLDKDLKRCIAACNQLTNVNIKIYIISDKKISKKFKNTIFKSFGKINMSKKRNLAMKYVKDKYIAFLDADCYPTKNWLINAINILKKDKKIGIVSGPDFPFPEQKGFHKTIGLAHKSFILSGSKTFRKNLSSKKKVKQVSSCNMILKKKTFEKVNGMDPKIYIGEDVDFCNRVNNFFKIIYSPNVKIFHKSRQFIPFLAQRFSYGTCILDAFKMTKSIKNIQYFGPLIVTLFLFVGIFASFVPYGQYVIFLNILILIIIIFESLKLSSNIYEILKLVIILSSGIIFFGIGSIAKIFGFSKNLKTIYTYR